jgi:hypothetical protein
MSSSYSVGLQNVGSYQVAGVPWLKDLSLAPGDKVLLEFPSVTRGLHICNDHNSPAASHVLEIMFCEPKRALNFIGANATYYQSDISSLALTEASISIWLNIETISVTRLFEIIHSNGGSTRMQIHDIIAPEIRLFVNGAQVNVSLVAFPFSNNEWINVTATIKDGESKLFINGQQIVPTNQTSFSDTLATLNLGADTTNFDGVYDNAAIFSRALTEAEVTEVYNDGLFKDPRSTSISSDIVGLWDFEDNQYKNFYSTPDTTSTINDRISNNNLSINGSSANVEFVDGQLIQNAEARHKIQLVGQEQITMECKTKQVFLSCPNGATVLSVCASLTNIPASRMYDLTGPGIDE